MKNLYTLFEAQVERHSARLAIEFRPRYRTLRWTYQELGESVNRLARVLAAQGIEPGDRILLYATNSPYWVIAYFGILASGAVVVPLNPRSTLKQLERIAASAEPKLVLRSTQLPWPAPLLVTLEIESAVQAQHCNPAEMPGRNAELGTLAEIVYTSGTTGDPKGVMLTHGNLLWNLEAVAKAAPLKSMDHLITLVPLFHIYGQMAGMLYPLRHGSAVSYLPSLSSRVILETLMYTPATHLIAVPEFLKTVMDRLETKLAPLPLFIRRLLRGRIRRKISKTLHTITCGGAPLDPELERKWRALGFKVLQGYGLTETSPIISGNTPEAHRLGSVGKPLEGLQVKIVPDGEILVKGPNVTVGYFRDAKRTEEAFEAGWFKTGDIGKLDEEGFLYLLGRKKYMIVGPGGENVFPEDLEAELNKLPGVKDSAVVGLQEQGRTVIHAVLLCDQCDGEAVVEEANRHLAPHQQIMSWSLWPEADFPRSVTRKVKKDEVIDWLKARQVAKPPQAIGAQMPLIRLLAEVTGQDPRLIQPSTKIVPDLNLDSLLRIELVSRIEEEFNRSIAENEITPKTTVEELQARLKEQTVLSPLFTKYPRWSLSWGANALRPLGQSLLCFSWLSWWCPLCISGTEYLKGLQGPLIFMANHRSYLDTPLIVRAIPRQFRRRLAIAAAVDTLYTPFWWIVPLIELIFNTYPFPTTAEENIKPGLEYTGRLLDHHWNVLVFPEGWLNRTDQPMQPLKGGAGVLAVEMQATIVPIAILGTEKILPPDTLIPRQRGRVEVRFGKPLPPVSAENYVEATQRIEQAIRNLL